jgi:di/tricarboxylate transporter
MSILLLMLPSRPLSWNTASVVSKHGEVIATPALLAWKSAHERMSWGVMLFFGGGLALAEGARVSCLSAWIGDQGRRTQIVQTKKYPKYAYQTVLVQHKS